MSKDKLQELWNYLDVKKLLLGMGTVVTTLILYIGQLHMSRLEENHSRTLQAIDDIKLLIQEDRSKFFQRAEKVDSSFKSLEEYYRNLDKQVAVLEQKIKLERR